MNFRRRRRYAVTGPAWLSIHGTASQTEQLEDRTLLSNLAITDAYMVDGTGAKITSPVLGERLEVRAAFTSDSLSVSAAYRAWVQAVSSSGEQSPWSRAIDFVVT